MTRGPRQCSRKLAQLPLAFPLAIALVVVVAIGLSACGGSAKHSSTSHTSSSTSTSASTTTAVPAPGPRPAIAETIRVGTADTFGTTVKAKATDVVLMRTQLGGKATSPPATIQLKLSAGPGKALTVTATSGRHTATAKIVSANGKPLTLVGLHYSCQLPPVATFCPARRTSSGKHGFELQFVAAHAAVVQVQATVGPVSTPTLPVRTAGSSVVPAYHLVELANGVTPPRAGSPAGTPGKATGASSSVTVKPGDAVVSISHLTGTVVGAPQAVTVTIQQGPARSVTLSAKVAGGPTSTATVRSGGGSPISLVLPHYVCFVAPAPTFCPAKTVVAGHHSYQLTFMASPYTPPIVLAAVVQAG